MTFPAGFQNEYLQLQGAFYLAERAANGSPLNWQFVGNCPSGSLSSQMESSDHIESYTGVRRKDLKLFGQRTASLSLTMENLETRNFARALLGKSTLDGAATVITNEPVQVGPATDNYILLRNGNVTTFTQFAATSGGAALPAAHYAITGNDLKYGIVRILNAASFPPNTQVFANYTAGVKTRVTGLSEGVKYYWLRFNGINLINNKSLILYAPKVTIIPDAEMELITGEGDVASLGVTLDVLFDELQSDSSLGYYYYDYF